MTGAEVSENPLVRAVVRMRRVHEPEAPFSGWLARMDDTVVQLVDVTELRGWSGWRERGEHHLAVQDVSRTTDGHEAVIPWCVERVEAFLGRRTAGGAALTVGEAVTIAVSLLRGCAVARGAALTGEWWLTHDGTPTFVCDRVGGGGQSIGHAAGALLERLAESRVGRDVGGLSQLAARVRAEENTEEAESRLFAIASPEPLVLAPLTPKRAADARRAASAEVLTPEPSGSFFGRLVRRHVDADVGGMVSDALDTARRGAERARRKIAKPWLVAGGIATVVVISGLAWPGTTTPAANARPAPTNTAASVDSTASVEGDMEGNAAGTQGASEPGAVASDDPRAALDAALTLLGACSDDACGGEFFEDAAAAEMPPGAVDLPAAERDVTLLDDLGGVAILSVAGRGEGAAPAQLVVLVRAGSGWLIRDVRDVEPP